MSSAKRRRNRIIKLQVRAEQKWYEAVENPLSETKRSPKVWQLLIVANVRRTSTANRISQKVANYVRYYRRAPQKLPIPWWA